MQSRIKAVVTFADVPAGDTVSSLHRLSVSGRAVTPDRLERSNFAFEATANSTHVTVTNRGPVTASISVLVEYWHTEDRGFGAKQTTEIGTPPFIEGGSEITIPDSIDANVQLQVYVDKVNGDDDNSGLAANEALATIGAVYRKFPAHFFPPSTLVVNLAGTGGFGADAIAPPLAYTGAAGGGGVRTLRFGGEGQTAGYIYRGPQMVLCTLATGPSTAALDVVPTVRVDQDGVVNAAGLRARFDFTAAAPGWTVSDMLVKRAFARIKRGANLVLFETPIVANTADTFVLDLPVAVGVVLDTDTVEIVTPGVQLTGDAGASDFGSMSCVGRSMYFPYDGVPCMERIHVDAAIFSIQPAGGFYADRCSFASFVQIDDGQYTFTNCLNRGGSFQLNGNSDRFVTPRTENAGASPINTSLIHGILISGNGTLLVGSTGAGGRMTAWYPISVYGHTSNSAAVLIDGPASMVDFDDGLFGSGNTGVGLRVRYGAQARAPAAKTVIEGNAGSPLQVESGAAIAYGVGAGQYMEAAGFNGNFHRVGGSTATVPLGGFSRIFNAN